MSAYTVMMERPHFALAATETVAQGSFGKNGTVKNNPSSC
jgi:hypothetical protein